MEELSAIIEDLSSVLSHNGTTASSTHCYRISESASLYI